MSNNLVILKTFSNPIEAHIVGGRLQEEGIEVTIVDEHLVSINWFYSTAIGGVKLKVRESDFESAHAILEERYDQLLESQEASELDKACPQCESTNLSPYLDRRGSFLSFIFLGFPVFLPKNKERCNDCGCITKS